MPTSKRTVREDIRALERQLRAYGVLVGPRERVRLAVEQTALVAGGLAFWFAILFCVPAAIALGYTVANALGAFVGAVFGIGLILGGSLSYDRLRRAMLRRSLARIERAPGFGASSAGSSVAIATSPRRA